MHLHLLHLGAVLQEIITFHQILPLPLLFHLMVFLALLRKRGILLQNLVLVKVLLYTRPVLQSLERLLVQTLHRSLMD